ncbi:tail fiber assembly protein [Pantoea vagans]|uniref:Tail fiber assembly protein n=1 Tax=Pantoea vagans TaxID=470934 RepID=A0AAN1NQC0_9GAMM|nr:tail fiber assembly protein [Pantoea vagans]AVV37364.1 hypothetical protein C9381_09275 [Pantoea vagans]
MMNKVYYDAQSAGFYLEGINSQIPSTAIEISTEDYKVLLSEQEKGMEITPNENGYPTLTAPPALTQQQEVLIAYSNRLSLMGKASDVIAPLQDAVDLGDSTPYEDALLKNWKQYRVALNRLDLSTAPDIQWPKIPG